MLRFCVVCSSEKGKKAFSKSQWSKGEGKAKCKECVFAKENRKESDVMCAAKNCMKIASNKCSACKQVSYCSRECQKTHWRDHKATCSHLSKRSGLKGIKAQTSGGSRYLPKSKVKLKRNSNALQFQMDLIKNNPPFDYIFVGKGERNIGIKFRDSMRKVFFNMCFERAKKGSKRGIYMMYEHLMEEVKGFGVTERDMKAQLSAEFGQFEGGKDADEPPPTQDELMLALATMYGKKGLGDISKLIGPT